MDLSHLYEMKFTMVMVFLGVIFSLSSSDKEKTLGEPDAKNLNYVVNFDSSLFVCPDDDSQSFVDTSAVEVYWVNETTACMTGTIAFLMGIHEDTMLELVVFKEVKGRWEIVLSLVICDVCQEIRNPDSNYKIYIQHFEFPESCPLEASSYGIDNLVASSNDVPINSANAGRYQVTFNLYKTPGDSCAVKDSTFIACLKLDFVIEPE